jgi:hypothetical protein
MSDSGLAIGVRPGTATFSADRDFLVFNREAVLRITGFWGVPATAVNLPLPETP